VLHLNWATTVTPGEQKRTARSLPNISNDHLRIERIALVAPMPLLAIKIFSIAWSPPAHSANAATLA